MSRSRGFLRTFICLLLCVIFCISMVRVVNGGDYLSFTQFLTYIEDFDLDVDWFLDTVNYTGLAFKLAMDRFSDLYVLKDIYTFQFQYYEPVDKTGMDFFDIVSTFFSVDLPNWFNNFGTNFKLIFTQIFDYLKVGFTAFISLFKAIIFVFMCPIAILFDVFDTLYNCLIFVLKLLGMDYDWFSTDMIPKIDFLDWFLNL